MSSINSFATKNTNRTVVTNDTLNFSKTNNKFSFSRDQRFSIKLDKTNKTEFNYELGSTLKEKRAGFGYGDRFKTPIPSSQGKVIRATSFHLV